MTVSDQYELLKDIYVSNAIKYLEAVEYYKIEHFSNAGIKSELAKLHHDMIMSCFPLYDMIAQVETRF